MPQGSKFMAESSINSNIYFEIGLKVNEQFSFIYSISTVIFASQF